MKKFLLIPVFLLVHLSEPAADSPLTSTSFSEAYSNLEIVRKASNSEGILTDELLTYLMQNHPIDVKMALINAIGWDINDKNNAEKLRKQLFKRYGGRAAFMQSGSADELLCLAYLKAMDDYFNVDDAIPYAKKAVAKKSQSFTVQVIAALIKAQKAMDTDWCTAYEITAAVQNDESLNRDMRPQAVQIIYNYMKGYAEYCD